MAGHDLGRVEAEQLGIISRAQALEAGVAQSAIRHALGPKGDWQRIMPGVYATFTGPLTDEHRLRAVMLRAGPEAALTSAAACRRYGMKYAPEASTFRVHIPHRQVRAPIRFAEITKVSSMPRTRVVRGVPTVRPERAALDAARDAATLAAVRAVLCEVVQLRLATADMILDELGRADPRGMADARRAVEDVRAGCRSAPECELRDLIRTNTWLPEPVWNQPLPDAHDIVPDGRIDHGRLVLEVESMEHHQFGDAPERTERRRARIASLGWRVYPVSPRRLREEPRVVLAEIEAAVRAGLVDVA